MQIVDEFLNMVVEREDKKKGYYGAIRELSYDDLLIEFYQYILEKKHGNTD